MKINLFEEGLKYYGITTEKDFRIHLLLDKYVRKANTYKARRDIVFNGVYFTKDEVKYLLGANNYRAFIKEVTEKQLLKLLDKKNGYGKQLYYFAPYEFTFAGIEFIPGKYKRIYNSLKCYKAYKIGTFSSAEGIIFENLKNISTSATHSDFQEYVTNQYPKYIEECGSSSKDPLGFSEYSTQYEYIWSELDELISSNWENAYESVTCDSFGWRTHTPITRSPEFLRLSLLIGQDHVVLLDLVQSQPTMLARILEEKDPKNDYTMVFKHVTDIYLYIKYMLSLESRGQAKLLFFKMIYGKPFGKYHDAFAKLFPKAAKLIEEIKRERLPDNPSDKLHSNLSMLTTRLETQIFNKVWLTLHMNMIPFTECYDEIIVPARFQDDALVIMNDVISLELPGYNILISLTREYHG